MRRLFTLCMVAALLLCVAVWVKRDKSWPRVIFVATAVAAVAVAELARRRSFAPIAARPCAGRRWLRAFPESRNDEVREFLRIVVDAFALRRAHVLKLRPDDRVMDIYRALNPPRGEALIRWSSNAFKCY